MDRVIVRTKLQAIIVRRLLEEHVINAPFHLILLFNKDEHSFANGLEQQCRKLSASVSKTTILARPKAGFGRLLFFFLALLGRSKIRGERVFCANVNWYPIALALRIIPRSQIFTFDDGSANVQRRNSSFLGQQPSQSKGLQGAIARKIFPQGPSYFVRGRIIKHWTIYPEVTNIVSPAKLIHIDMKWRTLISKQDALALPVRVRKIYLGTISEMDGRNGKHSVPREIIEKAINWADLYIPHPREPNAAERNRMASKYPAESIIDHYARIHSVAVAHHNSSASLSFLNNARVDLIDLSRDDLPFQGFPPAAPQKRLDIKKGEQ